MLLSGLTPIVGDGVRAGTHTDAIDEVIPAVVVAPSSSASVADALRWATEAGASVHVAGNRSKRSWGHPLSTPIDILLSLERLNRIVHHERGDLVATIEAGARLADVNRVLAASGQRLPLDPPHAASATIGGIVATNDSGALRHRYGTPRDLILGVSVATPVAGLASAGGAVVKNVAGYDLARLVCGSHGQLAVITSATFKLAPLPPSSATLVIQGPPSSLPEAVAMLSARQLEPSAVDLAFAPALDDRALLLVKFEAVDTAVVASLSDARAGAPRETTTKVLRGHEETECWQQHDSDAWGDDAVVRASWLPAAVGQVLALVAEVGRRGPVALNGRASVGTGLIRISGSADSQLAVIEALRRSPILGHVVVRHASREVRRRVSPWGPPAPSVSVAQAIKCAWDPRGTLSPGRGPL